MDADTAFAIGFLVGWVAACVVILSGKISARFDGYRPRVPEGRTGKPLLPQGGSETAPPTLVLPRGWPSTYPIPADELPPQTVSPPPPIYPPMVHPR